MPALTEDDYDLTKLSQIKLRINEIAARLDVAIARMQRHGIDELTVDGSSSRTKAFRAMDFFLSSLDKAITAEIEGVEFREKRVTEPRHTSKVKLKLKSAARSGARRK